MSSPFAQFPNAVLFFEVASLVATTTDRMGNPIPITDTLTYKALLRRDLRRNLEPLPGLDQDQMLLKGWLVDPLTYPPGVGAGTVARCDLTESPGQTITGELTILDGLQNPFVMGVNISFLTTVRGMFRPAR